MKSTSATRKVNSSALTAKKKKTSKSASNDYLEKQFSKLKDNSIDIIKKGVIAQSIIEKKKSDPEAIASIIKKSPASIYNMMAVAKMPIKIQGYILDKQITTSRALVLSRKRTPDEFIAKVEKEIQANSKKKLTSHKLLSKSKTQIKETFSKFEEELHSFLLKNAPIKLTDSKAHGYSRMVINQLAR